MHNAHTSTLLLLQFIVHIAIGMRHNIYSYHSVYFSQQQLCSYPLNSISWDHHSYGYWCSLLVLIYGL